MNQHYRAQKAAHNIAHRVAYWLKQHPGKTVLDALRAESKRRKRHASKPKTGVLMVHRKGTRKRIAMPVLIQKPAIRKGRGLNILPQLTAVEKVIVEHCRWPSGKPPYCTLSDPELVTKCEQAFPGRSFVLDHIKKTRQRLGIRSQVR